jgi:hypothetical protein
MSCSGHSESIPLSGLGAIRRIDARVGHEIHVIAPWRAACTMPCRLHRSFTMTSHRGARLAARSAAALLALFFTTACSSVYAQGRQYPNYPSYPNSQTYPGSRGGRGYENPAYTRGYDDGYRQGLEAGRGRDYYDPRRESWYRSADRGYDRRYGSRTQWRQVYRDGFGVGYDVGYRDGRYGSDGRYRGRRW